MDLAAIRLLVFDWDGTLIDSIGRIVASLQAAAQDCGLPPPDAAACRGVIGLSLPLALARLFAIDPGAAQQPLFDAYRRHYLELSSVAERPFRGLDALLPLLRDAGYQLAVATGKSRLGLDRSLRAYGLAGYFAASRCADETRSKPDPLMLEQLMAELAVGPQQTLMIGDSRHDMAMATAAGVAALGISHGVDDAPTLLAHGAHQVVADLAALGQLLLAGALQPA